ncbi:uncharacterized protein N7473_000230 [Penicillium subrubescens]|uniref:Uncharacterized protein n=1 Tax=Penicillium subrubescens TaxID=1316194 RepID=A0A1Q5SNM7_9EURO|nr:uncharacterized protein N7473_000230 [Penicillium subrubescens]KAJ5910927.1 hypothetical protein N7473_000230 [Penicillium subrubescens]OKO89627.1 hypothetical protein PENSUB_13693 [Penicillium subrubescens]
MLNLSLEVHRALLFAVSRADAAVVDIPFGKGLVKNSSRVNDPYSQAGIRSMLGSVGSPNGELDAVTAMMVSLLRHGIKMDSGNLSACSEVFDKEVQLVKQSPLGPGTYLQLLLGRGADPFSDGGPFEVESLLEFVIKQGAKQEMKLLLKGLDEHSISSEELEEIVTEVESQVKRKDKQNILPLLRRACCRKKHREMMPIPWRS